jgi:hypothetical protein
VGAIPLREIGPILDFTLIVQLSFLEPLDERRAPRITLTQRRHTSPKSILRALERGQFVELRQALGGLIVGLGRLTLEQLLDLLPHPLLVLGQGLQREDTFALRLPSLPSLGGIS